MIFKNNTNVDIERHKARLGLTGDVYLIKGVLIESLASHKRLIPESTATTIEEAEAERIAYEAQLEEARRQAAAERAEEEGLDGDGGDDLH